MKWDGAFSRGQPCQLPLAGLVMGRAGMHPQDTGALLPWAVRRDPGSIVSSLAPAIPNALLSLLTCPWASTQLNLKIIHTQILEVTKEPQ